MKSIHSLDHLLLRRGGPATIRRLRWIDARLHWVGEMSRGDLVRRFSISASQGSADFAAYREIAPGNLLLDHTDKRIKAAPAFRPLFQPDARSWLEEEREAEMEGLPDFVRANDPWTIAPPDVLREIVRSCAARTCVSVRYASLSSGTVDRRTLAPHTLVDVGDRLHTRAFDHAKGRFSDFVLSRMSDPEPQPNEPWVDPSADAVWRETVELEIGPRDDLDEAQARTAMAELGLPPSGGRLAMSRATAFYSLERLGLVGRSPSRYVCRNVGELPDELTRMGRPERDPPPLQDGG